MQIKNKTVLITGATSGIGRALAYKLAGAGAMVYLLGRREQLLKSIVDEITAKQQKAVGIAANITDNASLNQVLAEHLAEVQIDVLVNNAGLSLGLESIAEGKPEDWDSMIDTNVKGLLYATHFVLPQMIKNNSGHIVNIGSISGHETYPGGVVYCATKYAVRAITEGLKKELLGKAIRVSLVSPGMVQTEFSQVRFKGDSSRAEAVYSGMTPLCAEDVAESILFCLEQPASVNVSEVLVLPTDQSSTTLVSRKP